MKRIASILIAALLTCGICESAFAQGYRSNRNQNIPDYLKLSEKQMDDISDAAKLKVVDMNDLIIDMADKGIHNRKSLIPKAQDLFLEDCGEYDDVIVDKYGNVLQRTRNEGVRMELALGNPNNWTVKERLMRVYFHNLVLLNYKEVTITTTDVVNMKSTKPVFLKYDEEGNKVYKCLVTYIQQIQTVTHDNRKGGDRTTKTVECYVTEIAIPLSTNDEKDYTYMVELGNVLVDKLEKVDPTRNIELIP